MSMSNIQKVFLLSLSFYVLNFANINQDLLDKIRNNPALLNSAKKMHEAQESSCGNIHNDEDEIMPACVQSNSSSKLRLSDLELPKDVVSWADVFISELMTRRNVRYGAILYGPPGTGKSTLAEIIANESRYKFVRVNASALVTKWQGSGSGSIRDLFSWSRKQGYPVLICIDEFDKIASKKIKTSSGEKEDSVATLWNEIDACQKNKDMVCVFLTTNDYKSIDDRIVDRLRDSIIKIDLLDEKLKANIIQKAMRKLDKQIDDKLCLDYAKKANKFSGRALLSFASQAARNSSDDFAVNAKHLENAYDIIQKTYNDQAEEWLDKEAKKQIAINSGPHIAYSAIKDIIMFIICLFGKKS